MAMEGATGWKKNNRRIPKHDYQLNDNQNPKLFSPRHILKAVYVKAHYFLDSFHVNECFWYDFDR